MHNNCFEKQKLCGIFAETLFLFMTKSELRIKIADFLLDIAKLIVGGVVVTYIFDDSMPQTTAMLWGIIATLTFSIGGFSILLYNLKK
ncbi:hypothetical protein FACS1894156_3310 [Bacteroidia bacterium]|nr:hypothetical protein FACS1894156_3310 [Bacteroidia bacterium]